MEMNPKDMFRLWKAWISLCISCWDLEWNQNMNI
jgi:hypothetical protein